MSTSPYSLDLRTKVMNYLDEGHTQKSASLIFNINKNTVSKWRRRYKSEGILIPKKRHGAAPKIEAEEFINYVESHPDATASIIGKFFNISASGAKYWLKKLAFSFKKKPLATWKRMTIKDAST